MKITIISVGKIKEKYLKMGIEEYKKRLSRYCKLEMVEVPDEKAPENMSNAEEEEVKQKEGEKILKHIKNDTYTIVLAIEGVQHASEQMANKIETLGVQGKSHITFVIGGSIGLSNEVLKVADEHISFSKMTFPHQLMRMILLEQIYRWFRIIKNEPYHK